MSQEWLLYCQRDQQWWPIPMASIIKNLEGYLEVAPSMAARVIASVLVQPEREAFTKPSDYMIVVATEENPLPTTGQRLSNEIVIRGLNAV